MSKTYVMKFKENIDEIKKQSILECAKIDQFLESFGMYVIVLTDDVFYSLREDESLLYLNPQ